MEKGAWDVDDALSSAFLALGLGTYRIRNTLRQSVGIQL